MTEARIQYGAHGAALFFRDGRVIVLRVINGIDQPLERALGQGKRDAQGLGLSIYGHELEAFGPQVLDIIDRVVAGSREIGERFVAVLAQQADDRPHHLIGEDIDRLFDWPIIDALDVPVSHRFIPLTAHMGARARRAATRSIAEDTLAALRMAPSASPPSPSFSATEDAFNLLASGEFSDTLPKRGDVG